MFTRDQLARAFDCAANPAENNTKPKLALPRAVSLNRVWLLSLSRITGMRLESTDPRPRSRTPPRLIAYGNATTHFALRQGQGHYDVGSVTTIMKTSLSNRPNCIVNSLGLVLGLLQASVSSVVIAGSCATPPAFAAGRSPPPRRPGPCRSPSRPPLPIAPVPPAVATRGRRLRRCRPHAGRCPRAP